MAGKTHESRVRTAHKMETLAKEINQTIQNSVECSKELKTVATTLQTSAEGARYYIGLGVGVEDAARQELDRMLTNCDALHRAFTDPKHTIFLKINELKTSIVAYKNRPPENQVLRRPKRGSLFKELDDASTQSISTQSSSLTMDGKRK